MIVNIQRDLPTMLEATIKAWPPTLLVCNCQKAQATRKSAEGLYLELVYDPWSELRSSPSGAESRNGENTQNMIANTALAKCMP
jgi:hypothetical protein